MKSSHAFIAVALLVVATTPAAAQSRQPWSVQASGLYTAQDFGDPTGTVGGAGLEAQVRRTFARWSVGGGVQYSKHSSGGDDLNLTGFFVEPRVVFNTSVGGFVPYLAGRVAFLHGKLSSEGVDATGTSNGSSFGVGAGLIYGLTRRVNIDIGGAVLRQSLGTIEFDDPTAQPFELPSFFGYVLKAGLSIGFEPGASSAQRRAR